MDASQVDSHGWASRIYSSVVQAVPFNLAIQLHWNWVDPQELQEHGGNSSLLQFAINDMEVARETFHYGQ